MRLTTCTDGTILYPLANGDGVLEYPDGSRERLSVFMKREAHTHNYRFERHSRTCDLDTMIMKVERCADPECGMIRLSAVGPRNDNLVAWAPPQDLHIGE